MTIKERYRVEGENNENGDGWTIISSEGGIVYDFLGELEAKLICAASNDLLAQGIDLAFDDVEQHYLWQMYRRIEKLEEQLKKVQVVDKMKSRPA